MRHPQRASFSGHETFPVCNTWLKKAVDYADRDLQGAGEEHGAFNPERALVIPDVMLLGFGTACSLKATILGQIEVIAVRRVRETPCSLSYSIRLPLEELK